MLILGTGQAELSDALPLFSAALATLVNVVFGIFAWRSKTRSTRSWAFLCAALGAWSGALFLREMFGERLPQTFVWIVATLLAPASLAFVQRQGHWWPRLLSAARLWSLLLCPVEVAVLLAAGPRSLPFVAAVVYAQLLFALGALWAQDRRRGKARFRGVVIAGLFLLAASMVDALVLSGRAPMVGLPALRPLAALLWVALLGGSVARHEVYRIRPLLGRLGALSAVTTAVAAAILAPLSLWAPDSLQALLWCWFVVVTFVLLERPLLRFLRSPRARDRARRRGGLLQHLQGVDSVLAASSDHRELRDSLVAYLASSMEVRSVQLEFERPDVGPDQPPSAPARARPVVPAGHSWEARLIAQGRHQGHLQLEWEDREWGRDEAVLAAMDSFVTRVSTAVSALRLQEEKRRSEQLARLGAMASGIAHEVKNPLGAILGSLDLLEKDVGGRGARWLGIVREESLRLDRFVGEVLAYSRAPRLQVQAVDVPRWLEDRVLLARESARTAGVEVELEVGEFPTPVSFDPDLLSRAASNLILNAVSILKEAEPAELRVRVSARVEGPLFVLEVEDSGPGVDEEVAASIFDPFFTTRSQGTGLGLAICSQIVEAHRGRLILAETPGPLGGARFRIELPSDRSVEGLAGRGEEA